MPIVRKIIKLGPSLATTLPKGWVETVEEITGEKIEEVWMEVDTEITILPKLSPKGLRKLKRHRRRLTQLSLEGESENG